MLPSSLLNYHSAQFAHLRLLRFSLCSPLICSAPYFLFLRHSLVDHLRGGNPSCQPKNDHKDDPNVASLILSMIGVPGLNQDPFNDLAALRLLHH